MSTMTHVLGTLTDFSGVNNIQGLVNNVCKPLGGESGGTYYVDNSSLKYPSANLYFKIILPSTLLTEGGTIEIYLLKCLTTPTTQANWSEKILPNDSNDVSSLIYNLNPILTFRANADMPAVEISYVLTDLAYHKFTDIDGTVREVGDLPPYWSLAVWNKCGNTLPTSTHVARYQLRSYGST